MMEEDEDLTVSSSENEAASASATTASAMTVSVPVDDEAFETLAAEIREVMAELAQDMAMDAFRGEYEKLFSALERSHKNEKRLNTKCQELMSEIANQQARVDAAEDKSVEDQDTIASLKREIEKAWKMVDLTQEREERARETIETLNTEIQNLTKIIEEKTLGAEDTNLNELRKLRDELTNQRDGLKVEVDDLKKKEDEQAGLIKGLQAEKLKLENRIAALGNEVQSRTNEMNREIRRKERTEREVKQLRSEVDEKVKVIEERTAEISVVRDSVVQLEVALKGQKSLNDALHHKLEDLNSNISELQGQIELQAATIQHLEQEVQKKSEAVSTREGMLEQGRSETNRFQKELEEWKKKCGLAEKSRSELEVDRSRLKEEVVALKKEVAEMKRQMVIDKKKMDEKKHEISALEQNLKRINSSGKKQDLEMQAMLDSASEQQRKTIVLEQNVERHLQCIASVEEERNHYLNEAQELAKRVDILLDDVRDAEAEVFTYRKDLSEMENQIKQKHNLYQAARNDRTILNKNLTEAQDEISDLKGKLRVLQHQFDQLKEEMVAKEAALVKEGQEQQRILKEKEDLQVDLEKGRDETRIVKQKNRETEKNFQMITDRHKLTQQELDKTRVQLEQALRARSALNRQLAEKKESVQLLSRRTSIQDKVLARGEGKYQDRIEDIRVLKLEIKRLRQEEAILVKNSQNMEEMRKEVLLLQKDLLAEKNRVKSLQAEMESPLNIHRWRKLEGSDPSTFELIQKIQSLQKRLIAHKEEIVEKDLTLQEREKLVAELRVNLARLPQNDVYEELRGLKSELVKKKQLLKGLTAENNMLRSRVKDDKAKQELLLEETHSLKRKHLELDKRYQKLREKSETGARPMSAFVRSSSWTPRKFAGGGFNVSSSPSSGSA